MLKVEVDPHTHTIFSGHAFSTIGENARQAKEKGLKAIGMADHYGPTFTQELPGWGSMMNMKALPRVIDGVKIFASVEIDIVDFSGHLAFWDREMPFSMPGSPKTISPNDPLLKSRDYAIASVHRFPGMEDNNVSKNTEMYLKVLENPFIHIIGHPGRAGLKFDLSAVCECAKEHGKMLEINDHSFDSPEDIREECRRIALKCAETGTKVVVSSDAHSAWYIGHVQRALKMLEEIDFPQELIANRTLDGFERTIAACV